MNTKKIILSMVVLSSMIPSVPLHATIDFTKLREERPYFALGEKGLIAFLGLSIFSLFNNEPKEVAPNRFEIETFKQPSLIVSDPKRYGTNLYHWWRDRFIGQYFKDKYVKLKSDGSLKQSRKCPASGFLGHTFSYLIVGDKTQKMMSNMGKIAATVLAYKTINPGWARYLFNQEQKATGLLTHSQAKVLIQGGVSLKEVLPHTDIPKNITKLLNIPDHAVVQPTPPSAPRDSQQPLYPPLSQTSNNSNNQQQPSTTPQSNIIETHTITVTQ